MILFNHQLWVVTRETVYGLRDSMAMAVLLPLLLSASPATISAAPRLPNNAELATDTFKESTCLEIFSVPRQKQRRANVPVSVFVITPEDSQHAAATGLQEALRIAPNLQVARRAQCTTSTRGHDGIIVNKLPVLDKRGRFDVSQGAIRGNDLCLSAQRLLVAYSVKLVHL